MVPQILKGIAFIGIVMIFFSFDKADGWRKHGTKGKYEIKTEIGVGQNGNEVFTIQSIGAKIKGFDRRRTKGLMEKSVIPISYLGKRVRLTCYMKSKDVNFHAALVLSYSLSDPKNSLFWLGDYRAMKGTHDWKKYEIVFDVPSNVSNLTYGASLSGSGQIWFDFADLEIVDNSHPTTVRPKPVKY